MFESLMNFFKRNELDYVATDETTGKSGVFKFKIAKRDGGYRAYIVERPPLEGRDGSMHKVHVLTDNGKPYVCVINSIDSHKKMVAVAKLWARKYMRYVATGKLYEEE